MKFHRTITLILAAGSSVSCDDPAGTKDYELRVYGEAFVEDGIPAEEVSDGWSIVFTEFVVSIGEIEVEDDEVQALPGGAVLDLTSSSAGRGQLLDAFVAGESLKRVQYRIQPPLDVESGNASEEQVARLADNGLGMWVSGTATRADEVVTFGWGIPMDYGFSCKLGQSTSEPKEWGPTIYIHADHLLLDDIENAPAVAFDAIAAADADADANIDPAELAAYDVTVLSRYQSGSREIPNLWHYIGALAGTVGHIDGEGDCEPVHVPARFTGMTNPYGHGDGSADLYAEHCARCHGDTGEGDGQGGAGSYPKPTNLRVLGPASLTDDYLYYRMHEGGRPFPYGSEMPAFADVLDDEQIWRIAAYVAGLSHGE